MLYESLFPPRRGERVLDVGASALVDIPGENWFLRRYPYPEQVTAVVLWGAERLRAAFPRVEVVEADGRDLPFADGSFDVVHSNAVVEHVGPRPEQERFVAELLRVGRAGFVTTPNRWFPVESNSRLPLVGWLPQSWATGVQPVRLPRRSMAARVAGVPKDVQRMRCPALPDPHGRNERDPDCRVWET